MLANWKKHIALLLMLAYTSQSVAALLTPCHAHDPSSEPGPVAIATSVHEGAHDMHHSMGHEQHGAMEHSMQHHDLTGFAAADDSASPQINVVKADCCAALGHCLMGSCLVIHAASGTSTFSLGHGFTVADLYKLPQPLVVTSSHFRPPIFG